MTPVFSHLLHALDVSKTQCARVKRHWMLCVFLLLFSPFLFAGDKEKAVDYYHRGELKKAFVYMEKAARQGDAEAQGALGQLFSRGEGCGQ
ncbi:MAG: hypothetical protein GX776_02195, partial [Oxalobacter sp.]|nr:hypothetical protein [Oxalobacter sp.]